MNDVRLRIALWLLSLNTYKVATNARLFEERVEQLKKMRQCI